MHFLMSKRPLWLRVYDKSEAILRSAPRRRPDPYNGLFGPEKGDIDPKSTHSWDINPV